MPAPSSETVTVSGVPPVAAAISSGRAAGAETEIRTRAALARRLFCRVSAKMSANVAA